MQRFDRGPCCILIINKVPISLAACSFLFNYQELTNQPGCLLTVQGYSCPAAPLLSHQVLLALSPLHRHQLPQPELAPLLPSSFGPVVARVLSQQLGLGGCLREFEHEAAGQPAMWHVWWHIGLRRYHWQQQQQGDWPAAGTSSSSSSSSGLSRLSPEQLEALYSDPAAKCVARQLRHRAWTCLLCRTQAPSALCLCGHDESSFAALLPKKHASQPAQTFHTFAPCLVCCCAAGTMLLALRRASCALT